MLQVKKNQPTLLNEIIENCAETKELDIYYKEEKSRGRKEIRKIKTFNFKSTLWNKIVLGCKLFRHTLRKKGKNVIESRNTSYYFCNQRLSAEQLNTVIRNHWVVENTGHYIRDNVLLEDNNRIKVKAENMMVMRSFGYNIIQANKGKKAFTAQMETNKLNFENLFTAKGVMHM